MAQLATAAGVRTNTGLPASVGDGLIGAHLPAAEAAVLARVGSTIYAAITAGTGTTEPYTAAAKTALTRAECLLAGAVVLRNFLLQAGPGGVVLSVMSPDGKESQMATRGQLERMAAGWEAEAYLTISRWEPLYQEALRDAGSELTRRSNVMTVGRLTLTALSGRTAVSDG